MKYAKNNLFTKVKTTNKEVEYKINVELVEWRHIKWNTLTKMKQPSLRFANKVHIRPERAMNC